MVCVNCVPHNVAWSMHVTIHAAVSTSGLNALNLGWDLPRVPSHKLLTLQPCGKGCFLRKVLHLVWQSTWISSKRYLINIGSGAVQAPYPALLPQLYPELWLHRAQRYIPTTSLSRSSRSTCCAGFGDLHLAECLPRASLLRLHLEWTSSRTPTSLSSRTSQRTTENGGRE